MPFQSLVEFIQRESKLAPLWFIIRLYLGWQWLAAGFSKVTSSAWIGSDAGTALTGFLNTALTKTSGAHPDVSGWYAWLIGNIGLPLATPISYLVVIAEVLVGIALVLGAFTVIASFFGAFMNFNYLLAGTVSINPQMFFLQILLLFTWRYAGKIGLDHWLNPYPPKSPESAIPLSAENMHRCRA